MGSFKFRLPPPDTPSRSADLRKAYATGLDRTPGRVNIELRPNLLICHRESTESGRLFVPWPVEGWGTAVVGTATLSERPEAYDLPVELARGKLNDVRNQAADWVQMGLRTPPEYARLVAQARAGFARAALAGDDPIAMGVNARESLTASFAAGKALVEAYTAQVLRSRLSSSKLPTLLALAIEDDPKLIPPLVGCAGAFNAGQIGCTWRSLEREEGKYHWEVLDAQVAWCRRHRLVPQVGPLVDFRPGALPDWIWLWEGDFDTILGSAVDLVRKAVARHKGQVAAWTLTHRTGSTGLLGLTEEEQVRLTAKLLQAARQADPAAQLLIGLDRPWGEWMGSSPFQLGPLHLADYLARADLGLSGLHLEIALGYTAPGGLRRDLLDFSKLLDLYALLNLPLTVSLVHPSSADPDPAAEASVVLDPGAWSAPPDEASQTCWAAEWVALAVAKPYVRSVVWGQAVDSRPHLFPHSGLIRADHAPKPILPWLKAFRASTLA